MMKHDPAGSDDDDALVRVIQAAGDPTRTEQATRVLLDRWQRRIYIWVWQRVREREEALDLTQDCLVLLTRGLARYESRGNFGAWVFTIVRNRCLSALRPRVLSRDAELELESLVSPVPGPDANAEWREREDRVLKAMECGLEPQERVALWLRAFEGLSVEAIGRALDLRNPSGARALLQTARRKLRAALDESDEGGSR
ncbi:MAG: RNA polymerase sigma factor [Candidatus Eiseniibacteriota bacterium]